MTYFFIPGKPRSATSQVRQLSRIPNLQKLLHVLSHYDWKKSGFLDCESLTPFLFEMHVQNLWRLRINCFNLSLSQSWATIFICIKALSCQFRKVVVPKTIYKERKAWPVHVKPGSVLCFDQLIPPKWAE